MFTESILLVHRIDKFVNLGTFDSSHEKHGRTSWRRRVEVSQLEADEIKNLSNFLMCNYDS